MWKAGFNICWQVVDRLLPHARYTSAHLPTHPSTYATPYARCCRRCNINAHLGTCQTQSIPVHCIDNRRCRAPSIGGGYKNTIRRPFDCLSKITKVTATLPANRSSHADLFIYLILNAASRTQRCYGRNVAYSRRTVVARSNCSRSCNL